MHADVALTTGSDEAHQVLDVILLLLILLLLDDLILFDDLAEGVIVASVVRQLRLVSKMICIHTPFKKSCKSHKQSAIHHHCANAV